MGLRCVLIRERWGEELLLGEEEWTLSDDGQGRVLVGEGSERGGWLG